MRLNDYLAVQVLELMAHTLDLAKAVKVYTATPTNWIRLTLEVLPVIAVRRG